MKVKGATKNPAPEGSGLDIAIIQPDQVSGKLGVHGVLDWFLGSRSMKGNLTFLGCGDFSGKAQVRLLFAHFPPISIGESPSRKQSNWVVFGLTQNMVACQTPGFDGWKTSSGARGGWPRRKKIGSLPFGIWRPSVLPVSEIAFIDFCLQADFT